MTDSWNPMPEGLPRPLGTLPSGATAPVPWSQDGGKWGEADPVRVDLAREFSRCLVCGELVVAGKVLVNVEDVPEGHSGIHTLQDLQVQPGWVVDHGPVHDPCAAIAGEHCPAVKRRLARGVAAWRPYESPADLPLPPDHWTDGVTAPAPRRRTRRA